MQTVSLIVKATRLCNLRCTYCHDWAAGPDQTMSFDVLAHMTAAALQDPEHADVEFIWHGGETTLLPIMFYRRALALQARFRRPGQTVRNSIQTNCTRLTEEWARFLRSNHFTVGVSLDGPPEIHDKLRRDVRGMPTFERVLQGLRMLDEFEISYCALIVVTDDVLDLGPDRLFDFLLEVGIKRMSCLEARPVNQPEAQWLTPTENYTEPHRRNAFLARLYDRWRQHGDPEIDIRELAGVENLVRGGRGTTCQTGGDCFGKYYLVEPNGDVAHCDLFIGDDRYTFGNVCSEGFPTMRQSRPINLLRHDRKTDLDLMRECPEFSLCRGWCPHERYTSSRHNAEHDDRCCGLRGLIDHVRHSLEEGHPGDVTLTSTR